MSESSISPNAKPAVDAEVVNAAPDVAALNTMNGTGAVAPRGPGAVAQATHETPSIPHVNLAVAYGVGFGVTEGIATGALCFDKKHQIVKAGQPLVAIINNVRKYWKEWPEGPFNPSYKPAAFATEAEALAAGFRTQYSPKGSNGPKRNCAPGCVLELFVQQPEKCSNELAFCVLLNGKRYAPARMYAEKGLFASVEKILDQLQRADAAARGVAPADGKWNQYFVTLVTQAKQDPQTGKTDVRLYINPLLDNDSRSVKVDDKTRSDLAELAASIAAASAAPAATDEEAPF